MKFRVKSGKHATIDPKTREPRMFSMGEVLESDKRLDLAEPDRFDLVVEPGVVASAGTVMSFDPDPVPQSIPPAESVPELDDDVSQAEREQAQAEKLQSLHGSNVTDQFVELADKANVLVYRKGNMFVILENEEPFTELVTKITSKAKVEEELKTLVYTPTTENKKKSKKK